MVKILYEDPNLLSQLSFARRMGIVDLKFPRYTMTKSIEKKFKGSYRNKI